MAGKTNGIDDLNPEIVEKFKVFLLEEYRKELYKAAEEEKLG